MTRNRVLAACIELTRAEADMLRAKARLDTQAVNKATQRLRNAKTAILKEGGRCD